MKLPGLKRRTAFLRHACIYISSSSGQIIVVAMHHNGAGGILFEDSEPIALSPTAKPREVGFAAMAALQKTNILQYRNFADHKRSDWPAFRLSKMNSVKRFEQEYI